MPLPTPVPLSNGSAAAKSFQSCPTLCDPVDGSPPGSPVPGILQARTLEWAAISFSNAWKWKVKVKSLSRVWLPATPWTAAHQAPLSMGPSRREHWSGVPVMAHFSIIYNILLFIFTRIYKRACVSAKLLQYVWLCDPMDHSPPGSSVHGILQARILKWVAMHSSREFSRPWDWTQVSYISCTGRQVLYH